MGGRVGVVSKLFKRVEETLEKALLECCTIFQACYNKTTNIIERMIGMFKSEI